LASSYGCGSPIPSSIAGLTVLDLGSGTGLDVFVCSALVGQRGHVTGVDMTPQAVERANSHIAFHTKAFGFANPNVDFRQGYIEHLDGAGIAPSSVDLVISNCVINLSPDKASVLKQCATVLKEGGEMYFSDVFCDRRIPSELQVDPVLWGECFSGALYWEDFRRLLANIGFMDVRIVAESRIVLDGEFADKLKDIQFVSRTISAFKLSSLEDRCEDYGQQATYKGGIQDFEKEFPLDGGHVFKVDEPARVCGNTAATLGQTRYAPFFDITPKGRHLGVFGAKLGSFMGSCAPGCCS